MAREWNTILYRLYVRPPAQPAYAFANRTIAGAGGKLKDITNIAIGIHGSLFLGSRAGVIVIDAAGAPARSIGTGEVRAVAVDAHDRVVLAQKAMLQQEGATGTSPSLLTLTIPRAGGAARVLDDMTAVVVLSTGDRLIADKAQRGVFRFDAAGKFVAPFATVRASRMAAGPGDLVAMLDQDTNAITVLDRTGKPGMKVQTRGSGYDIQKPLDLAFDSMGHLYVLERAAVYVFAPDGRLVTTFTTAERTPGAFKDAEAIAVDAAGRLYVFDNRAERIQVYQ